MTSPIDLTSGSDSSLMNFLNSSSASQGRNSSASLPWADPSEQILQNQLEWERIERIFYGEEELPADPKTKAEFLEWMNAFPYLRVTGKSINTPSVHEIPKAFEYKEIVAKDHKISYNYKRPEVNFRAPLQTRKEDISKVIETRSGHVLNRRFCCGCKETSHLHRKQTALPDSRTVHYKDKIDECFKTYNVTSSANPVRMPPILNLKLICSPKVLEECTGSTCTSIPDRTTKQLKPTAVTLPVIQLNHLTLGDLLTTRSISAAPDSKHFLLQLPSKSDRLGTVPPSRSRKISRRTKDFV